MKWQPWRSWLAAVAIVVVAVGFVLWRQLQPAVEVSLDPAFTALGHPKRVVTLVLRAPAGPLARVEARVIQGDTVRTVPTGELSPPAESLVRRSLTLDAAALGLEEGAARLEVFARDAVWRLRHPPGPRLVHRFTVDLTPPRLEFRAATRYLALAGAGVAVYRVEGEGRSGVRVGSTFFPGVSGLAQDPAVHVALFAMPYDEPQAPPSVVADDTAGNERVIELPVTFLRTRFPKDTIRLNERFLRRKVPELVPQTPGTASGEELLEAYLEVNREGRQVAEARVREVTQGASERLPLWEGPFHQQSNTKVTARFPEERTYLWNERAVDTQWHLGIDLASRRRSPVEAANAGRVVFAGQNGIYGNMVVLDHGLALFTLYAHLSEIAVETGQQVAKGDTLGRTGETGLAGGDHLHFAVVIHGVYVTPLEWWDGRWIRDRILEPLEAGGVTMAKRSEAE